MTYAHGKGEKQISLFNIGILRLTIRIQTQFISPPPPKVPVTSPLPVGHYPSDINPSTIIVVGRGRVDPLEDDDHNNKRDDDDKICYPLSTQSLADHPFSCQSPVKPHIKRASNWTREEIRDDCYRRRRRNYLPDRRKTILIRRRSFQPE